MATEINMPKLGLTMVEGKIVEWKKKEGEPLEKAEIVVVIETEKVTYELEAPTSGILGRIVVPEGETVPIGAVLAYIVQKGETLAELPTQAKEPVKSEISADVSKSVATAVQTQEKLSSSDKIRISPLAKKMAMEHGLDISKITGTGPEGRIVKEDVYTAIEEAKNKPIQAKAVSEKALPGRVTLKPLSGMRRTIARRMSESFQTIPHFWVHARAEATRLREMREQMMPRIEATTGQRLTYTDFLIKMIARALEDFPNVNSRWTDNGIELLEDINIGVATAVSEGLIVPVVRTANKKSLIEITAVRSDLVQRGRAGKLGIDELTGSTFTLTNIGISAGITGGNPIINPPEVAILGISPIADQAVVIDGQVVARLCLNMTLAIDHRVLDGVIAAEFLSRMKELIENPLLLI